MKIKKLYEEYKRLSKITEENENDDEAWDMAYQEEFKAFKNLENEIVKTLNIEAKTARAMINNKRFEELMIRTA